MKTLFIALLLAATAAYGYDWEDEQNRQSWQLQELNNQLQQQRTDRILQERREQNRYEQRRYQLEQQDNYNPYMEDYNQYNR